MAYAGLESQCIRLLKLEQSTQQDAIIVCSLVVASLSLSVSAHPQYEALSYVWGDSTEQHEILLDGRPTLINRNLWIALKHIRKPDSYRTLWIDAICINQDDINERNEQVGQMGRIYSKASRVLIWLGPPDEDIENTMLELQVPGVLEDKQYEQFPKHIALGLKRILSRPWWHRIWVIQEHVLASADPIVGCGHTWLGWPQLSEALLSYSRSIIDASGSSFVDESSSWATDGFTILRHVLLRKQWNDADYLARSKSTLAEIMERTRGYQATDRRDQVFAVWDLLCEADKAQLSPPDYTKSVNEVYQEATVAFIRSKNHLAFLILAIEKDSLELPSWCVDFSKRMWDWGGFGNYGGDGYFEGKDKGITPDYMNVLSHDKSLGVLTVLGGVLGEVVMSSPFIPLEAWHQRQTTDQVGGESQNSTQNEPKKFTTFTEFLKGVLLMSAFSFKVWEKQHGAQAAKERLAAGEIWKTLFGGLLFTVVDAACIHAGLEQVDGDDRPYEFWIVEAFVRMYYPWYEAAIEKMGFLHPTPELADSRRLKRALYESLMLIMRANIENGWFATDTGYIALVTRNVERGDRLCTIFGCRTPFVLRSINDGFQLIAMAQSEDFDKEDHRKREGEVKRQVFRLY
jgi:hypothetical protein